KDIFRIRGWVLSSLPMPPLSVPVTTLNTPAGIPARSASTASASAVSGVCEAGRNTTVQPAAKAGATLRVIMAKGKFQGVMAATTPMPWRMVTIRFDAFGEGMVSPYARLASSAYQETNDAP